MKVRDLCDVKKKIAVLLLFMLCLSSCKSEVTQVILIPNNFFDLTGDGEGFQLSVCDVLKKENASDLFVEKGNETELKLTDSERKTLISFIEERMKELMSYAEHEGMRVYTNKKTVEIHLSDHVSILDLSMVVHGMEVYLYFYRCLLENPFSNEKEMEEALVIIEIYDYEDQLILRGSDLEDLQSVLEE